MSADAPPSSATPTYDGPERRRSARHPVQCLLDLYRAHEMPQVHAKDGTVPTLPGWVANIGLGGASLTTSQAFSDGDELLVEFALPDGPTIHAIGRIIWLRADRGINTYGLAFDKISWLIRWRLRRFLSHHQSL